MLLRAKQEPAPKPTQTAQNKPVDDKVLWANLKRGNELAFSMLYERHVQRMYNYGMHMCGRRDLVMDTLQELFSNLWAKRSGLADARFVNQYLFSSYRRLIINKLVKGRKLSFLNLAQSDVFEFVPSFEESLIEGEQKAEQYKRLRASVNMLTKRQREAIFLKFYSELSYAEVATTMELHQDSVYNLISKAIERLRRNLDFLPLLLLSCIV
jgi:RNA polymerase sigma factor (sigma-70 family)